MTTIGISGSRGFEEYEYFKHSLIRYISNITDNIQFCSGSAFSGADFLIKRFCEEEGYKLIEHLPDYKTHGKKAPILRNSLIVQDSDLMVFYWNGISRGTKDTIEKCKKKGIPYRIVNLTENNSIVIKI